MLRSVARSCVRHARKMSFPVARLHLFPVGKSSQRGLDATGSQHAAQRREAGSAVRSASLTAAPAVQGDGEGFGSLSGHLSSRRSFKKSSPDAQEARLWEHDAWEAEEDAARGPRMPARTNTPYWYFLQCKKLIKDNKLQEALDMFSTDMLQVERLQPEEFNYTVLIGGCGRAGQLKKAFKLYNDMKKRGLTPVDATYTALFNACAESQRKEEGLQQALKLEQELRRKNYQLSTINYQALLKTHAYTNHLQACIHTLREMLQNGHVVTQETFHYLLMGSLKDKETGFRLALQVWRQMLKSRISPDSRNYNLLLRTARDCGIGDPALATEVLLRPEQQSQKTTKYASRLKSESEGKNILDIDLLERQLFIQPNPQRHIQESTSRQESTQLIEVTQKENPSPSLDLVKSTPPNLLDLFECGNSAVVSLSPMVRAPERLALIGGVEGFLEKMAANGLCPDLKTLTLLADMMEPGYQSLQILLKAAKQHKVKLDVAFFNTVIRKEARGGDLEAAKGVLSVMRQRNVSVNAQTFGSLALGCDQQKDGLQLLKDMEEAGFMPNVHVFSAFIGRATKRQNYVYLKMILKCMSDKGVGPNKVIIKQLEFASQYPPNYNQYKSRNNYLVHIDGFRGYYQQWLRYMPAQDAENAEAEQPKESDSAEPKTIASDGQIEVWKKQSAVPGRYPKRDKTGGRALQQNSRK